MDFRRLAAAALLTSLAATPSRAGDADPPLAARVAECLAICDEWAAAPDDAAKLAVEARAAKLPPLPAEAVEPVAARLFELAAKTGPKLKKSGSAYFYDEKEKRGLYMVAASGKKHGGLLIAMHGGGEGQGDAGGAFGVWSGATSQGMTVIAPEVMSKVSSAWNQEPEERMVLELIEAAKRTWDIDTNHVYLAGHSMGGDGSWMIGGRNADLLAGCSPLAGSVMPYMKDGARNKRATPIESYEGLMEGVLPNLMYVPYWIHHSADDENEAIHPDDIATGRLTALQKRFPGRYEFRYDRVDGNKHALPKGGVKPILDWLAKKERVTYPTEVVWETWWSWKRQMYWLHSAAPREACRFHAKIVAPNTVEVSATAKLLPDRENPKSFELTILCSPKLFDMDKPLRVTCGETVVFEGAIPRTLWSLLVSVGRRNDPAQWFEGHVTVTLPRAAWSDLWDAK